MGASHLQSIYIEPTRGNIAEILNITTSFTRFVSKEENQMSMEEVLKEE
jgi:hypothetical protein